MTRFDRRQFLLATIAASATMVGCAREGSYPPRRQRHDPYRLWDDVAQGRIPGGYGLVAAATLAASPHNTQAWRFRPSSSHIDVFAAMDRHLGALDPLRREMWLGLGCAVENLVVAAAARGCSMRVELLPSSADPRWAARVHLGDGRGSEPLVEALPRRHTQRAAYDTGRGVDRHDRVLLAGCAADAETRLLLAPADSEHGRRWGRLAIRATERIVADSEMASASQAWFRYRRRDVREHRDGPTLRAAGLPRGQRALAALLPEPSPERSHEYWLRATRERQVPTAALWGVICVRNRYDRRQALQAGRLWQRLHLTGTALGLAMQPLNQVPEVIDRDRNLGNPRALEQDALALTGAPDSQPTFVFRVGHAPPAPRSPRLPLEEVIA